jgi:hypothetical protein
LLLFTFLKGKSSAASAPEDGSKVGKPLFCQYPASLIMVNGAQVAGILKGKGTPTTVAEIQQVSVLISLYVHFRTQKFVFFRLLETF